MTAPSQGLDAAVISGFHQVVQQALGPYQTATVRIGIAGTWLGLLLREWPNRHELYGPDGPYNHELASRRVDANGAFSAMLWSDGTLWFEFCYLAAIAASVALLVGWRTRTASVLFMAGVLTVQNRNAFVGDGGDNLVHLLAIYLVAVRCGKVWSLDARRERLRGVADDEGDVTGVAVWSALAVILATVTVQGYLTLGWALIFWALLATHAMWWGVQRYAPGEPRHICDMAANLLHNGALLVIISQMCLLYAAAGWYKVQGTRWQDGTGVFYPLQIDAFTPWPALTDLLSGSAVIILVLTYGTVIIQVAFPFTLINRRVKNAFLALLISEHIGIAILLGLPFFSMAVIAGDLVFLPTALLLWVDGKASGLFRRGKPEAPAAAEEPKELVGSLRP